MHVEEIMANYQPAYPDTGLWEDTFRVLREDPNDWAVVQELLAHLGKDHQFREPVILSSPEEFLRLEEKYPTPEDEEPDVYTPYVQNGTHRIYAHYLSGHKDVKVQVGYSEPDRDELYPILASRVIFPEGTPDETVWELFDKARSFKLTDDLWVTSDILSSSGNTFESHWNEGFAHLEQSGDPEELERCIALMNAKLTEIGASLNLSVTPATALLHSEEEDDEFFEMRRRVRV